MNTQFQKEHILELPEGFTARGATLNDVEPALELVQPLVTLCHRTG